MAGGNEERSREGEERKRGKGVNKPEQLGCPGLFTWKLELLSSQL
jgi:hypothetical protein